MNVIEIVEDLKIKFNNNEQLEHGDYRNQISYDIMEQIIEQMKLQKMPQYQIITYISYNLYDIDSLLKKEIYEFAESGRSWNLINRAYLSRSYFFPLKFEWVTSERLQDVTDYNIYKFLLGGILEVCLTMIDNGESFNIGDLSDFINHYRYIDDSNTECMLILLKELDLTFTDYEFFCMDLFLELSSIKEINIKYYEITDDEPYDEKQFLNNVGFICHSYSSWQGSNGVLYLSNPSEHIDPNLLTIDGIYEFTVKYSDEFFRDRLFTLILNYLHFFTLPQQILLVTHFKNSVDQHDLFSIINNCNNNYSIDIISGIIDIIELFISEFRRCSLTMAKKILELRPDFYDIIMLNLFDRDELGVIFPNVTAKEIENMVKELRSGKYNHLKK